MAALSLNDVTVRRGPTTVVNALTVEIRPGSVFWVVGPNGAGKSSLLRVMAGLDAPDRGTLRREPGPGPFRYLHSEMTLPSWSTVGAWERLTCGLGPGLRP
ncbi:MAG: ATP-binding cassette domain-containing protein, partial [Longimicrobiales bacterium]|nr:ATP-binding cassette domain-containing protein [Longimicrobiales bacterium]